MHIGFRTSGGRGEYEIVSGAGGQSASDLEGWTFHMRWPDGRMRDTQLWLDPGDSGKPRLRSLVKPEFQIGRMVASMLLLPAPRRELPASAVGYPVVRQGEYFLKKVGFGPDTSFASPPESVQFTPNYVEVENREHVEQLGVEVRWRRIEAIYAAVGHQDATVATLLRLHQDQLNTGDPITTSLPGVVKRVIVALAEVDPAYVKGHDPLPALERRVGIQVADVPDLPPPGDIGEEDAEVRVRSAHDYRLSKSRGPSARAFSKAVREAYGHRCMFCGVVLGGFGGLPSGVDAAHILAWTNYDLDVVKNGIALCRLHHWAFDAALLVPVMKNGGYVLRFTARASKVLSEEAMDYLGTDGFEVPEEWLPADRSQWPSKKYLTHLYDDLSIVFD